MTNLRTYYGKELWKEKKALKNAEGDSDPTKAYHSKWHFFKSLDFLRDNCNPRHSKNDLSEIAEEMYDDDDNDASDTWGDSTLLVQIPSLASDSIVNGEKDESKDELISGDLMEQSTPKDQTEQVQTTLTQKRNPEKRKRLGDDIENVIAKLRRSSKTEYKEQNTNSSASSAADLKDSHPDMVFAQHVGLTLMNMKNPKLKDLAKLKIQQVLFETQYGAED